MGVFLLPETETSEVRQSPKEAGGCGAARGKQVGLKWVVTVR